MTKLSILIATMPKRKAMLADLVNNLYGQIKSPFDVDVLWDDSMQYNIGTKRNKLLQRATGEYIVFIDDDDEISPNYISQILNACSFNPDCIGINGTITTNGENERQWFISKEYGFWYQHNGIYFRTPNHISPVRRELALQAEFPEIAFGEDAIYSERLLPLLKTEYTIGEPLYKYKYVSKK